MVKRNQACNEAVHRVVADQRISRRQLLKLLGGACAYGVLASMPWTTARAQASTDLAVPPDSILGPAIATQEQAARWLSSNNAHGQTYDWIGLAWAWGGAVGIRSDLMLAQEMFETGWGHFGGIVAPQQHNVAGIKVGNPNAADLPGDFERFATWSEGIRAHANHLGAYSGAVPVLGPNGEPVHDRYYVVRSAPWAGTVETIGGLSGKWSVREDYGQVLQKRFLDPLRNV